MSYPATACWLLASEDGHRILICVEALLPASDPASENLAAKCELQPVDEPVLKGMCLYRGEL